MTSGHYDVITSTTEPTYSRREHAGVAAAHHGMAESQIDHRAHERKKAMARNRPLVTKRSRRLFGERLEAWDRECLARSMRHVDFIPLAGLRDFSKTMIEVLWGIGFATHTRRRRGLSAQEAKVCPELVGELAWTVFYSSWCSYPEGDGDQVSGAER